MKKLNKLSLSLVVGSLLFTQSYAVKICKKVK